MTRKECECFRQSGGAGRLHRAFENRSRFHVSSRLTVGIDAAAQDNYRSWLGQISQSINPLALDIPGGCSCTDFFLDFLLPLRR